MQCSAPQAPALKSAGSQNIAAPCSGTASADGFVQLCLIDCGSGDFWGDSRLVLQRVNMGQTLSEPITSKESSALENVHYKVTLS